MLWTKISNIINIVSGLTVAVARAETPVVNGYFCLPTQTKAERKKMSLWSFDNLSFTCTDYKWTSNSPHIQGQWWIAPYPGAFDISGQWGLSI